MGEKTRFNNDQEDELNQSRFLAERGTQVPDTQSPGKDGTEIEEEDILDTKSRFREAPASKDKESEIADQSRFYGQGFDKADDTSIRRGPEPAKPDETGSLGA
jgi:hypothetical protein